MPCCGLMALTPITHCWERAPCTITPPLTCSTPKVWHTHTHTQTMEQRQKISCDLCTYHEDLSHFCSVSLSLCLPRHLLSRVMCSLLQGLKYDSFVLLPKSCLWLSCSASMYSRPPSCPLLTYHVFSYSSFQPFFSPFTLSSLPIPCPCLLLPCQNHYPVLFLSTLFHPIFSCPLLPCSILY